MAAPVSFSGLILIMVWIGKGRGLCQGLKEIEAEGSSQRGIFRKAVPSHHDAGSGSRTHAKGERDPFLQSTQSAAPILLGRRLARQVRCNALADAWCHPLAELTPGFGKLRRNRSQSVKRPIGREKLTNSVPVQGARS